MPRLSIHPRQESPENLWGLVPVTTGFGSRHRCHACDTTPGVVCQPIVALFHIVPYFVMSRFTAQSEDEGLPGNWTDAVQETLLLCSSDPPSAHTHTHIYPTICDVHHPLQPWGGPADQGGFCVSCTVRLDRGSLYSWLLPVLTRVHEWITPLAHGDPIGSHGNVMENDACNVTEERWLTSLYADLMGLQISEAWERKKR